MEIVDGPFFTRIAVYSRCAFLSSREFPPNPVRANPASFSTKAKARSGSRGDVTLLDIDTYTYAIDREAESKLLPGHENIML